MNKYESCRFNKLVDCLVMEREKNYSLHDGANRMWLYAPKISYLYQMI